MSETRKDDNALHNLWCEPPIVVLRMNRTAADNIQDFVGHEVPTMTTTLHRTFGAVPQYVFSAVRNAV